MIHKFFQTIRKKIGKIEKRFRFAISTFVLVGFMLLASFFSFDKAFIFLPILVVLSYILTYFSLLEGVEKMGWFGLFFMPVAVTVSWYLFYYLFPVRWITRFPFVLLYGISIYATFLCSNIFNVGVEKNLQLYRAAFSVNFFYHALTMFFFLNIVFSLQQYFIVNALVCGVIGLVFSIQLLWTIRLKKYLDKEVCKYAVFVALVLFQAGLIISFLPLQSSVYALFITTTYYSLTGLIHHFVDQRLFKETIREYSIVWVFVLVITLLAMG